MREEVKGFSPTRGGKKNGLDAHERLSERQSWGTSITLRTAPQAERKKPPPGRDISVGLTCLREIPISRSLSRVTTGYQQSLAWASDRDIDEDPPRIAAPTSGTGFIHRAEECTISAATEKRQVRDEKANILQTKEILRRGDPVASRSWRGGGGRLSPVKSRKESATVQSSEKNGKPSGGGKTWVGPRQKNRGFSTRKILSSRVGACEYPELPLQISVFYLKPWLNYWGNV